MPFFPRRHLLARVVASTFLLGGLTVVVAACGLGVESSTFGGTGIAGEGGVDESGEFRGGDAAPPVAEACGQRLCHDLHRVRHTQSQTGLNRRQRAANVTDAFAWTGQSLTGQRILLVDDVLTTGATLDAAAHTLRAAGAREVWGLVLAKR